jgi:hypothetical protein
MYTWTRTALALAALSLGCSLGCGGDDGDGDGADVVDAAAAGDANAADANETDLAALSDDFEGDALDGAWAQFRPELIDIVVADGALSLTPNQRALWFDTSQGPLIHKSITGDFKVSAPVRVRRASAPGEPPDQTVHLGGLMARTPVAEGEGAREDYVFIVVGFDVDDLSVETKTTDDGASVFEGPTWGLGDAELRICRLGDTFHLFKRVIGDPAWTLAISYSRPDMPETLQVGPIAYANTATPDLVASFDAVAFAPAASMADCTAD